MSDSATPGTIASVHDILQARIPEWVGTPFSRGFSWSRYWICIFCIAGEFFIDWATREAIYTYIYISHFLNPFINQQAFDYFHNLALVNNAAKNMRVQISLRDTNFISFVYTPKWNCEPYCSSTFNFLRKFYTVLHSDCTNLFPTNNVQGLPFPQTYSYQGRRGEG